MTDILDASIGPCLAALKDPWKQGVRINGQQIAIQQPFCVRNHGDTCDFINKTGAIELAPQIYGLPLHSGDNTTFTYTRSKIMLESTTLFNTNYGVVRCLPDVEYNMWKSAHLCERAPLIIKLDDVIWRIIASESTTIDESDAMNLDKKYKLPDNLNNVFTLYVKAHMEGGKLLDEVKAAVSRGFQDLYDHRKILFKLFHVIGLSPTLSHDLSKTHLVNFCLGRNFHANDLDLLKVAVSGEECMTLNRTLHLEVENHHPEHGARPAVITREMYLDRVSRAIQKSFGWDQKAWSIPEIYTPAEYREDFRKLEEHFSKIKLEDPGEINVPDQVPGATIGMVWENC